MGKAKTKAKFRKAAILLAIAMAAALLGGCGKPLDASGYVKALLDNSYKGDSTAFVEQKVGTKKQAEDLYKQGIDTEMKSLTSEADISEELEAEFREVVEGIFKNVKYTVGESSKKDDSYEVVVNYQKMNIFAAAMEEFNTSYGAYAEEMAQKAADGEEVSEKEINEQVFVLLKDAMKDALGNVSYADEASTVIHVELQNDLWAPNEADVQNLEKLLFDMEVLGEMP